MDIEKLIEQLNDWNEKYISNLCGDRTIKCEEYCIKDDCLIVKAATALSTLQAENEKLRAELEKVKRCIEIVKNQREQMKRERDAAIDCIYKIEDALDRGNDNDWAREHISEWESQKED